MRNVWIENTDKDVPLSQLLQKQGCRLPQDCGGRGACGKCRVFIDDKAVLACKERPIGSFWVTVPYESEEIVVLGAERNDRTAYADTEKTDETTAGTAVCIDIGTTTLAAVRVECKNGEVLAQAGGVNHQRQYGADVMTRIAAASNGNGAQLQQCIQEDLRQLLRQVEFDKEQDQLILSGNTTMQHLLCGYPCESLGKAPYKAVDLSLRRVGKTVLLPGISAFVGADIVSGLYALDMDRRAELNLFLDLGTNGEIAVGNREKILTAATAAGPALEGGNLSCGMAAITGAIYSCEIEGQDLKVKTIGGQSPAGICGSGVLELCGELLKHGQLDSSGLLAETWRKNGFPLTKTLRFRQQDVREVQLAKSAIRAGMETLLAAYGIDCADIANLYLAGGFSKDTNIRKFCDIGLLPDALADKVVPVGNTSLQGAVRFARDRGAAARMERILRIAETVPLEQNPLFCELYMEYMSFERE